MQAHISNSLANFKDNFCYKYRLFDYTRKSHPAVFIGMYNAIDWSTFIKHKGHSTVVFQGMDCKDLTGLTAELLKLKNPRVICISHWQSETLKNLNVEHELIPVSATIVGEQKPVPRGTSVYFYSSDLSPASSEYYGESMLNEIREKTKLNIIRATYNTFTHDQLQDVYKECFVGLRLTQYDGLPNGVLEMGLLGRRTIFNGKIPHAIHWTDVDDICEKINQEYENRNEDNKHIHTDIANFVNIPNNLFYERTNP